MPHDIVVKLSSNVGYWQADWRDVANKRHKQSLGPKTSLSRRQAQKLCKQLANQLNERPGLARNGSVPRLGEYIDTYVEDRTELKPTTRYLFELTGRYLKTHFSQEIPIDRITRQAAREWRTALARGDFSNNRPMAEVSVCHRCADAKAIFKRAVDDDLILFNPFDRLKVHPPKPDKSWHYVTMDELDKLLAACKTTDWKVLIALCRLAGLRRGEALALPWSTVDWQRRRLTVYAQKTERHGGNKRIVPIDPKLYAILLTAFQEAPEGRRTVCAVNPHCLWRNFTVIRKHAGLQKWKDAFQVMRRNCETDWAQRFPQYAVSEWIGHDIAVSAAFYLSVTEELYEKAASQVSSSIAQAQTAANPVQSAPKSAPKS
jgi:integrase